MQRIMIAGIGSGCGKTTVTCAVLSALRQRGVKASAFKCGPDYIDPMFYREILGTPSHNLDSFFCDRDMLCHVLERGNLKAEIAVIEGVMGFYDGGEGSAYRISEMTETPVVLVLNCRGMKESIGAVMQGFLRYQTPNRIAGFIFNKLPLRLVPFAEELCRKLHTAYFGCLPAHEYTLESRHLGLVTVSEIAGIQEKMNALGFLAAQHILLDKMLETECGALPEYRKTAVPKLKSEPVIAVARDKAFCFLYEENLSLLREIGCALRYFSPLADAHLPEADGLLLCGGYPELYAAQLSENQTMLADIRNAVHAGMPVIAECGGFMYLHDTIQIESGTNYEMAGVIDGTAYPTKKLQRFGYVTMQAHSDNLLCNAGDLLKAHEFHYWDCPNAGTGFTASKADGRTWECCHVSDTMYAGFPHLYFMSDIRAALKFAAACAKYGGKDESYSAD
ncbi:MAG: cobyrinate a,c-diamide synthase [Oscillospiraceae bacterium]|nr:cobyrinate a,c-diamide synthase [Oscillospiraceae bacterium]